MNSGSGGVFTSFKILKWSLVLVLHSRPQDQPARMTDPYFVASAPAQYDLLQGHLSPSEVRLTCYHQVHSPPAPPLPPIHHPPCIPPQPCVPPHGHRAHQAANDNILPPLPPPNPRVDIPPSFPPPTDHGAQTNDSGQANSIPRLTITQPTPLPSPPPYPTSSPPKYAPLPSSSSEQTLLLAPPPTFAQSQCQGQFCPNSCTCNPESRSTQEQADWVVRLLILLNILVWGAVVWGYYVAWMDPGFGCGGLGIGCQSRS